MTVVLIAGRITLNVVDSNVIDVGYSGVIGADRIADREPIYDNFPSDDQSGDTYGPVAYYAYVPFEQALPWSGTWDDLPAAHAASIFFDLATMVVLFLIGRRLRRGRPGTELGILLCFAWAACPYTAYALESNTNDALVSLGVAAALLCLTSPMPARDHAGPLIDDQIRAPRAGPAVRDLRGNQAGRSFRRYAKVIIPFTIAFAHHDPGRLLPGPRGPRPLDLLAPHDRRAGRPRLPLQRLGPGSFAGLAAGRRQGGGRRAGAAGGVPAASPRSRHGRRSRSRGDDRHAAHRRSLVLPLHPLVPARSC